MYKNYFTKKAVLSILLLSFINIITNAQVMQQGAKLVGTGAIGPGGQGRSVAISADGNTAVVGAPSDNNGPGAIWIYIRSGGVWSQQGAKLVGTGGIATGLQTNQGVSAAISADGNTVIVGSYGDNDFVGAAWIFTRSGGVWSQQGSKLIGTGAIGAAFQGTRVAISADGNTAIVGGPDDNDGLGAIWIYTRSGGVWTQQGSKLVGTGTTGDGVQQGYSVSISGDGNTAVVGGVFDNSFQGAVWVFTRSGGIWSQQGSKLVGTGGINDGMAGEDQGSSVAISADGNTFIEGALNDNSSQGAAWIFTRSGSAWSQQGLKLVGTGNIGSAEQGYSVSISGNGDTAVIGGLYDNGGQGAAWIYTRSGGIWSQQDTKLVGTGSIGPANLGTSVAISANGTTVITGGPQYNNSLGAAWVFVTPAPTSSVLSAAGASAICNGSSANLKVTIIGGTPPYTVVYSNGAANFEVNNYISGVNIPVSPAVSTTWSLVSVTDANLFAGTGISGTPTTTVYPVPDVTQPTNQILCNNSSTAPVNFSGPLAGTFNWTNNTPSIGLAATGTGNIPSFTATNLSAAPVTATITVTPSSGNFAYIPNSDAGSNNVVVVNLTTNSVIANIPVGLVTFGVSVSNDGSRVYVTNNGSNNVSVINTATNSVMATISVGSAPNGVCVSPDGSRVYVANSGSSNVSVINTGTNSVETTIPVKNAPTGVAVSPDGSRVYVTDAQNNISVINSATNSVVTNISAGVGVYGIAVSPDGSRIYVANFNDDGVSVINTATNTVIATISTGSGSGPVGVSVSPDGSRLYVTNTNSNNLSVINTATNLVIATIPVGTNPHGVSVSQDGSRVYVANFNSNNISVINTATNSVIATVSTGVTGGPYSFGNFLTINSSVCTGTSKTFTIKVNPTPTSTCPTNSSVCINATAFTLSGGSPSGGTYSGTGVSGGMFNPATAGVGPHTITYSYTDGNGCTNSCSFTITVNALQTVTCPPNSSVCINATAFMLTGGSPSGGTYSGAGVSSGMFNPASAGAGPHTITYSVTDGNGCTNSCSFTITVNALPTVTCPSNSSVCINAAAFTLTGGSPSGGTYSGTGVSAGMFNPSTAGVGSHTITYSVTNGNGCANSGSFTITVNALPMVTCPNFSVCGNAAPFALTGGSPSGGTYSGANVSGGMFNPSAAGVGAHTVTYSYTDLNGCANTCNFILTVSSIQDVNAPQDQTVCNNTATNPVNFSGSAAGTVFNWTNNTISIGLTANGSGNIPSFTATNSTTAPVTATVTVTPSSGSFAYVANFNSNSVSVVNIATGLVVATIGVGSHPYGVSASPDGSRVYVTNFSDNTVSVINTATGSVVATISVGAAPQGVSVSPDGGRVYIANNSDGTVSVINAASNSVIATVPVGISPFGLSVNNDGSNVYVTNSSSGTVSVINTASNVVIATIPAGASPRGILVSPDGSEVYVANGGSADVSLINTASNTVVATIPVGSSPFGISASTDGSLVYVANNGSNSVSVINTATNTVVVTIPVGSNPFGVSVGPDGSRVYVANNHSGNVSVINTATNAVVSTLTVGSSPTAFGNFMIGSASVCTGASKTFTITVNPAPAITCPGDQAANTSPGSCNAIVNYSSSSTGSPASTISYVFSGATSGSGSGNGSGSAFNSGMTVVTLTATDLCDATANCTFKVVVTDKQAPVPDVSSLPAITGQCSATVNSSPTATDNCAGSVTGTTTDPLTYTTSGTFTIHWTYSDGNGNTAGQDQTVIVQGSSAPVPDITPLPTITGQCSATVSSAPTAIAGCVGSITGRTTDPLTYTTQGTFTIHWVYSDGNGHTVEQDQTVTVKDMTAPLPDLASLPTISGQCSATVTSAPTATDNCAGSITATTTDPLTYTTSGTFTIHWTYSDGNGNSSTQNQTVVVQGSSAPVPNINPLPTITGGCSASVSSAPTATASCTGSVTGTTTDPLTYTTQGTFTIHWTYSDGNGHTTEQDQTVTVNDVTNPTITAPSSVNVNVNSSACSATGVTLGTPVTGDNCGVQKVTNDAPAAFPLGTTTVTWVVTDIHGRTATATQTVTVNSTLNASLSAGSASCSGGTLTVNATGGGGSYTYSLDGITYQPGNTFAVSPGTYTVTVKDAYGCTKKTNSVTVTQSAGITASASAGTISCFGGTTTLTITASGGKTPYSYSTNGTSFQTSNKFTQAAGAYTVTVKDANGCKTTTSGTIAQPAAISISLSAGTISCYGGTSTLTITATGGTPAYTYSLNGCTFQSNNTFTASATTCAVTVKDSKGCTAVKSLNISQPAAINVTAAATPVLCNGGTSAVTVSATGGTAPYTGTGTFTRTAGTYTFNIKDSKNCSGSKTITISQPTVLTASLSTKTMILCYGSNTGSVTVKGAGGTQPYTYKINTASSYQSSATFNNLAAGTYSVTVKDNNGCSATVAGISVTQPATVLALTLSKKTDASCATAANGSITVSATGGTPPFKYSLNNGSYGTSSTFSSLRAGTYTVNAKDANSCIKSITVVINGTGKCNNLSVTDPAIADADIRDGTWLKAVVSPNPSEAEFTLTLTGNSNEPVDIRVTDMYGRAVHFARGSANQSYQFGQRFAKGMYVIEILQGKFSKTIKIIKGN